MKKGNRYIWMLLVVCLLSNCTSKTRLPDLRETYRSNDTNPFGGNIACRLLQNSFPDNYVRKINTLFDDESGMMASDKSSLYFYICRSFTLKDREADELLDYVYKGNTFFLSAGHFDSVLLEKIYCTVKEDAVTQIAVPFLRQTAVKLTADLDTTRSKFSYYFLPFSSSFSAINSIYSSVLGYNGNDEPNCIVFFWGKGKMILHTDPRAFSNYFLLKDNNYRYLQDLLQVSIQYPEHIYWNDYSGAPKNPKTNSYSGLEAILNNPPLAGAFWVTVLLLGIFILFGIKRKQKVIRQVTPNVNSSVSFTETIARLYFQQNDNKNIADKMITYFNEFVRTNYFLYGHTGSDEFIRSLSRKSCVSLELTTSLYRTIDDAGKSATLDDVQLLALNDQIQQFYKTRK